MSWLNIQYESNLRKNDKRDGMKALAVYCLIMCSAFCQGWLYTKGVHDNGYGLFLSMLEYKLEERGKYLIKVDRYFASSKICSVCGKKKEELSLSDRIYYCECGNRMDRDVNAAVNIMNEGKRIFAECA